MQMQGPDNPAAALRSTRVWRLHPHHYTPDFGKRILRLTHAGHTVNKGGNRTHIENPETFLLRKLTSPPSTSTSTASGTLLATFPITEPNDSWAHEEDTWADKGFVEAFFKFLTDQIAAARGLFATEDHPWY